MYHTGLVKHLRTIWCMLEAFCFGGLQIGWASLVYILKQDGYFADGCDQFNTTTRGTPVECEYQDAQMSMLFSLANGVSIVPIFLCGNFLSRFGPVKTRIIWTCLFILGCIMMLISTPGYPWFVCAGVMLLAGGGSVFLHANMQISRLYSTGSFFVIALINGCYDSSSAVTLFMKLAYEAGITKGVSFALVAGLALTAFANTYVNFTIPELRHDKQKSEGNLVDEDDFDQWSLGQLYKEFVCNAMFISHFVWFTLMDVHFVFFITISNVYINRVSEKGQGTESSLTNFLSITMLCGVATAVIVGVFFEQLRLRMTGSTYVRNLKTSMVAFVTTTLVSATLAAMSMSHNAIVASCTFVIFPLFRSLLFSTTFSFVAKVFPDKVFGSLVGVLCAQSAVLFLIQRALFHWFQAYGAAELHIKILFFITSLLAMHHPLLVFFKIRKMAKEEKTTSTPTPHTYSINAAANKSPYTKPAPCVLVHASTRM